MLRGENFLSLRNMHIKVLSDIDDTLLSLQSFVNIESLKIILSGFHWPGALNIMLPNLTCLELHGGSRQWVKYCQQELPAFFRRHTCIRTISLDDQYHSSLFEPTDFRHIHAFKVKTNNTSLSLAGFRQLMMHDQSNITQLRVLATDYSVMSKWLMNSRMLRRLQCLEVHFSYSILDHSLDDISGDVDLDHYEESSLQAFAKDCPLNVVELHFSVSFLNSLKNIIVSETVIQPFLLVMTALDNFSFSGFAIGNALTSP